MRPATPTDGAVVVSSGRDAFARERAGFVELLSSLTPEQWEYDTLCEGWTVRDLLAHLLVREAETLTTAPGLFLPGPFAEHMERRRRARASRPAPELLLAFRNGPPYVHRLPVVAAVNAVEHYVHQEDVRRGQLQRPREQPVDPGLRRLQWGAVKANSRVQLRRVEAEGIVALRTPEGREVVAGLGSGAPDGTAEPDLVLTGEPGDLLLLLQGRGRAAAVDIDGPDDLVGALRAADLSI